MAMFYHRTEAETNAAYQSSQIAQDQRETRGQAVDLAKEVDRLALICEALWTLVKERLDLTDDELMGEIARLDLSDGRADGRKAKAPTACSKCGRMNSRRHDFCIYCGKLLRTKPFE